jgi:hypothetical protein
MLAPVVFTGFLLGLSPASTLASASMLLENTFPTPLVSETAWISQALGQDRGTGDLGTFLLTD